MTGTQHDGEANKALVRRFVEEVWNQGNVAAIEELVAPDFVEHALWPNLVALGSEDAPAREQISSNVAAFRDHVPDLTLTIDMLLASEDKVTAITTFGGTSVGNTGPISWTNISIYRIAAGKIAEMWVLWDRLGRWQQLGMVPPTRELMERYSQTIAVSPAQ